MPMRANFSLSSNYFSIPVQSVTVRVRFFPVSRKRDPQDTFSYTDTPGLMRSKPFLSRTLYNPLSLPCAGILQHIEYTHTHTQKCVCVHVQRAKGKLNEQHILRHWRPTHSHPTHHLDLLNHDSECLADGQQVRYKSYLTEQRLTT